MLSNGGEKMEYEYLNIIIGELKILRKLQLKLLSQYCENITPEQVKLLYLIKKEKLKQKEIAQHLHITEATLSVRIKRLVDLGWIERVMDKDDKRLNTIVLSDQGEQLMDKIEDAFNHYQKIVCQGLTKKDYEYVLQFIHKIQENLKEEME